MCTVKSFSTYSAHLQYTANKKLDDLLITSLYNPYMCMEGTSCNFSIFDRFSKALESSTSSQQMLISIIYEVIMLDIELS